MKVLLIALALATITGCQTPQPQPTQTEAPLHLDFHHAKEKALLLYPDMPMAAVIKLLGRPDETASSIHGAATASGSWRAFVWTYKWGWSAQLRVTFHLAGDDWIINNWDWLGT